MSLAKFKFSPSLDINMTIQVRDLMSLFKGLKDYKGAEGGEGGEEREEREVRGVELARVGGKGRDRVVKVGA